MPPDTRYAKSEGINIAYQVTGEGPFDLVLVPGWVSHVENAWEEPSFARFLHRLTSFCRLILLGMIMSLFSESAVERQVLYAGAALVVVILGKNIFLGLSHTLGIWLTTRLTADLRRQAVDLIMQVDIRFFGCCIRL